MNHSESQVVRKPTSNNVSANDSKLMTYLYLEAYRRHHYISVRHALIILSIASRVYATRDLSLQIQFEDCISISAGKVL